MNRYGDYFTTVWKCCWMESDVFRRDEEIFERLEDRSRKLVDSKHLDEGSRRGNEKRKEQKFLVDGDAVWRGISSNYGQYSRWFIYKWFTLGRLGRHDYRIGLCIFPCRCTNIKWAIWRLVKRQSANVREDILDSVKQGGKGTEEV